MIKENRRTIGNAVAVVMLLITPLLDASAAAIISFAAIAIFAIAIWPEKEQRRRYLFVGLIALLAAITFVVNVRFLAGEDDWMCQNGAWVKHGNPSAPMPSEPCR